MRVIRAWADPAPPQISAAAARADRASRAMPACIFIVLLLDNGGGRRAPLRAAPRRPARQYADLRRGIAVAGPPGPGWVGSGAKDSAARFTRRAPAPPWEEVRRRRRGHDA